MIRNKVIRYVFLNPFPGFGGLEIQMVQRAMDALEAGNEGVVVTLSGSKADEYCRQNNVPTVNLDIKSRYFDIKAIFMLGKIFEQYETDVCVAGKTEILNIAVTARNLFSKKTKIVLYQQMQSGIKKVDFFHNRLYRNLDGAIVIADYMKHQLANNTIFPFDKIDVIPCGIKTELFSPELFDKKILRKEFGLPEDCFIFGNIGRFDTQKDQMTAIEAFAEAGIDNSLLVFAGNRDDADYFNLLKTRCSELNIKDKVMFLPFTNKVPELMNTFDVFILPSLCETLGLVLIEAMSAGVPCIATRSGGVVEIIDGTKNGLFFEPADRQGLVNQMRKIAADDDLREQIRTAGKITAKEKFDYYKQSEKFLDYCRRCL